VSHVGFVVAFFPTRKFWGKFLALFLRGNHVFHNHFTSVKQCLPPDKMAFFLHKSRVKNGGFFPWTLQPLYASSSFNSARGTL
jgi:hypothetical protein